jgi:hypothetical protein
MPPDLAEPIVQYVSVVRVPELLQEFWNVMRQHIVHALNHLGPHPLEFVEVVSTQDRSVLLDAGEISCRQVQLLLNLHRKESQFRVHWYWSYRLQVW